MLNDGEWFKIFSEDNNIKVIISEKEKEYKKPVQFYIFGMGLRDKFIVRKYIDIDKYELMKYENHQIIESNLKLINIDYENYNLVLEREDGTKIKIYEDNEGIIFQDLNLGTSKYLDNSQYINIPQFEGYEHKTQLKILFNEVMINVTKDGPKPNFIAYDNVWYRDAAMIAMVLEKTNNINQIKDWINSIKEIYDKQNGIEEPDNLGQVLYLMSLTDNRNEEIINKIIKEANKLTTKDGYICGYTDGAKHPVYQTKWLIFGLKSLNLPYNKWVVPEELEDDYSGTIWFEDSNETTTIGNIWPYLYFANLHYRKEKINFPKNSYPISNEFLPNKANYEKFNKALNLNSNNKLIMVHAWSAAEEFLYLKDLDEGIL